MRFVSKIHFTKICSELLPLSPWGFCQLAQAEKWCRKKRPMDEEKWFAKMLWSGLGLRRWMCWELVKSWFLPQRCEVVNRINTEVVIYMNVGVPPPPNSSDHLRLHYIFSRGIRDPYKPLLYIVTGKGRTSQHKCIELQEFHFNIGLFDPPRRKLGKTHALIG